MTSMTCSRIRQLPIAAILLAFMLPTAALAADPTPDPAEPSFSAPALALAIECLVPYRNH